MATKQYHGSCICGAVKFEAGVESTETSARCNCSNCWKLRFWFARVKPENFRLLAGENALTHYFYKFEGHQQIFCKTCGVHPFHTLDKPGVGNFVSINVACLDDLSPEEWSDFKIKYMDGKNDQWWIEPKEKHFL